MIPIHSRLWQWLVNHRESDKQRLGSAEEIERRSEQVLLKATRAIAALEAESKVLRQ